MLEIQVLNAKREILTQGPISQYPLPEPWMVELSTEFFQDPQPCMIHKSAVLCRIYGELEEQLKKEGGEIEVIKLSPAVRALFEADPEAFSIVELQIETKKKQTAKKTDCKRRLFIWNTKD